MLQEKNSSNSETVKITLEIDVITPYFLLELAIISV